MKTIHCKISAFLLLIVLPLVQIACTQSQLDLYKAASRGIAVTIAQDSQTVSLLASQGKLTATQAEFWKAISGKINLLDNSNQSITKFPPANKLELIDLASSILTSINPDPSLHPLLALMLGNIRGLLAGLITLLGGGVSTVSAMRQVREQMRELVEETEQLSAMAQEQ